jgi:hypothetical protein
VSVVSGTALLWSGAGGAGSASRRRRLRHRVRTLAAEHPRVYLPFARRKYPGPSPRVIRPDTQVVIDGYTRSASTFAVYAFQLSQPTPVRLAHHLHASAQLIEGAKRGLPTIAVVREPKGAVLSQVVREPGVDLLDALYAYRRFYTSLMAYRHAFVIADFREVTWHFGSVVRRLNERFGTSFGVFNGTPSEMALCRELIELRPTLSPYLLGFESGDATLAQAREHLEALPAGSGDPVWVPSPARNRSKAALDMLWSSPRLESARNGAEDIYHAFSGP